jgi:hypothetical protein
MNRRRAILALVLGTLVAPAALTCNIASERGSLKSQVLRAHKGASVVVLAKVVDARFQGSFSSSFSESPIHRARLEVIEVWKGKHRPGTFLETTASTKPGVCAVVLTPGETYLLYLRNREPYDVSALHRSAKLADASQDIQILRSEFGKASL